MQQNAQISTLNFSRANSPYSDSDNPILKVPTSPQITSRVTSLARNNCIKRSRSRHEARQTSYSKSRDRSSSSSSSSSLASFVGRSNRLAPEAPPFANEVSHLYTPRSGDNSNNSNNTVHTFISCQEVVTSQTVAA